MNSPLDRPRLRLAWTGIATLLSLFPTLLYFTVSDISGLEGVLRKKEALLDGLILFGGLQAFAFVILAFVIILIWRPKRPGKKEDSCSAC